MEALQEALGQHREGARRPHQGGAGPPEAVESHKASWLAAQMEPSLPSAVPTPRVAMPEYSLVRNYLDQIPDNFQQ